MSPIHSIVSLTGQMLAGVLWSFGQALVGVLQPAASRRVERLARATSLLLLAAVLCLSMGLGLCHAGVAWMGAWVLSLIGAACLLAAGVLGSFLEPTPTQPRRP